MIKKGIYGILGMLCLFEKVIKQPKATHSFKWIADDQSNVYLTMTIYIEKWSPLLFSNGKLPREFSGYNNGHIK